MRAKEVSMGSVKRSLEGLVVWLEERGAHYNITPEGIRAKVLLRDNERIVRVTRGPKGNLIGRVRGSSKVVVFPEPVLEELEEGQVVACKIIEKDRYFVGVPLRVQNDPQAGVHVFWIERP
jgi:hypothetical protein